MEHLLGKEDIIVEKSPFHKATLVRGNNQMKDEGDSCCKDLSDDLVDDVAKTNGAIVSPSLRQGLLRDEYDTRRRDVAGQEGPVKELLDCIDNIRSNSATTRMIEGGRESIRARCAIPRNIKNRSLHFILIWGFG